MANRQAYHHGELREALIVAAVDAARAGGPQSIGMRELARAVGVSPNAAYRHFEGRDALIRAAAPVAMTELAAAIRAAIAELPALPPREAALARLRGIALGYLGFARRERGWFLLAFAAGTAAGVGGVVSLGDGPVEPFRILVEALDDLVATGALTADRREHAEWVCWSGVHGFAELVAEGPLRGQSDEVVDVLADRVIDATISGLLGVGYLPDR